MKDHLIVALFLLNALSAGTILFVGVKRIQYESAFESARSGLEQCSRVMIQYKKHMRRKEPTND